MNDRRFGRVVLFVPGLGPGGAERVAARVSAWLVEAGYAVRLVTLSSGDDDFYSIDRRVERVALALQQPSTGALASLWHNIARMLSLRAETRQFRADVVISLSDRMNVLTLLALTGLRFRKIISERADPVAQPLSRGWSLLRRLAYPMAHLHVSQSEYVSRWVRERFPAVPCVVIGNTGGRDAAQDRPGARTDDGEVRFLAIGRLTWQKGFDILLPVLAMARPKIPRKIALRIIGEGEDRSALEQQIRELGLCDVVVLAGRDSNSDRCFEWADAFLMPSRYEGFPNVLIEAMAAGVPAFATRCPGGTEDILGDEPGRYALEAAPGDTAGTAKQIIRLANDPVLRNRLAEAGIARSRDYSPHVVARQWLQAVEGR